MTELKETEHYKISDFMITSHNISFEDYINYITDEIYYKVRNFRIFFWLKETKEGKTFAVSLKSNTDHDEKGAHYFLNQRSYEKWELSMKSLELVMFKDFKKVFDRKVETHHSGRQLMTLDDFYKQKFEI